MENSQDLQYERHLRNMLDLQFDLAEVLERAKNRTVDKPSAHAICTLDLEGTQMSEERYRPTMHSIPRHEGDQESKIRPNKYFIPKSRREIPS